MATVFQINNETDLAFTVIDSVRGPIGGSADGNPFTYTYEDTADAAITVSWSQGDLPVTNSLFSWTASNIFAATGYAAPFRFEGDVYSVPGNESMWECASGANVNITPGDSLSGADAGFRVQVNLA
jgi:hypothetical protein